MPILRGNQHSIGTHGWKERDYSYPTARSVGTFGYLSFEGLISGITSDPSFEYLYVHPYASGHNNGFSWKDAFTTIGAAVDALSSGLLIEKHVDGSIFGVTGVIILTGVIENIAVARDYTYEENISLDGIDDNRITIEGGFAPSMPLPSSYVNLESSGTNTILQSTGCYFGSGFYITQPGEYTITKFTLKNYEYGIFSTGNYIDINEINISGCKKPIELKSTNYNINEININSTGQIDCAVNITNSTGNIFNTIIDSGHYGLKSNSGQIRYCAGNEFNNCGTGVYIVNNVYETVYLGEDINGNLFSYNHKGIYLENITFEGNYNTIYATSGIHLIGSTGTYDNGIISYYNPGDVYTPSFVLISSQLLINNGCIYVPTYATGNYTVDASSLIMLSGRILYTDPGFVQPESGNFKLDIQSRCLNQAKLIRGGNYTHYPINTEAVQIIDKYAPKLLNTYKDNIKILDNSIIYINPISGYTDSEVDININEKKTIEDKVVGISSFDINSGEPNLYPYDYKIISRFNNKKNVHDYYLIPYTIFELKPMLETNVNNAEEVLQNITQENIEVKTDYRYSNIVYDNQHGSDSSTNEIFYILEKNNQYLIKTDMMQSQEIKRYHLMRPDSSGINYKSIVYPSGLKPHRELKEGYEFETDYFQDKDKIIKTNYITCLNQEGAIKWLPTDIDKDMQSGMLYRDIRGLTIYDGDLYYLIMKNTENNMNYKRELVQGYNTELINIDLDNEIELEKIHSGQLIDLNNPVSITVNRDNRLVIINHDLDTSGNFYAKTYKFCYDYAMIDKNTDNTNRIYFREHYPGGINI